MKGEKKNHYVTSPYLNVGGITILQCMSDIIKTGINKCIREKVRVILIIISIFF